MDEIADNEIVNAKRKLNEMFDIPNGFSDGKVDDIVDSIVKGAILKVASIQAEVLEKKSGN